MIIGPLYNPYRSARRRAITTLHLLDIGRDTPKNRPEGIKTVEIMRSPSCISE